MDINVQNENKSEQKRLRILNEDEIETLYGRPRFTHEERRSYFSLSQPEKEILQLFRSIKAQAYFVLQLGYFKAKHLFYLFSFHEVEEDLKYVLEQYFDNGALDNSTINKRTRLKQQHLILQLTNYRNCGAEERKKLEIKAHKAVAVCSKPLYILRELLHYLFEQHIMVPGYSFMQEIVGRALVYEQNRLTKILKNHLEQSHINVLKQLLEDSYGLYMIT
jgi:hypothetical protein